MYMLYYKNGQQQCTMMDKNKMLRTSIFPPFFPFTLYLFFKDISVTRYILTAHTNYQTTLEYSCKKNNKTRIKYMFFDHFTARHCSMTPATRNNSLLQTLAEKTPQ